MGRVVQPCIGTQLWHKIRKIQLDSAGWRLLPLVSFNYAYDSKKRINPISIS